MAVAVPTTGPCVSYAIHDNGGHPFRVTTRKWLTGEHAAHHRVQVCRLNVRGLDQYVALRLENAIVHVGCSPLNATTRYNLFGPAYDGNTVLLKDASSDFYYLVYDGIFKFKLPPPSFGAVHSREITTFVSPIGNNDCPYPYAIDNYGDAYVFESYTVIQLIGLQYEPGANSENRSVDYYTPYWDVRLHPFGEYFSLGFSGNISWCARPDKAYDKWLKDGDLLRTKTRYDGVGGREISREDFVAFCEAYAHDHGLLAISLEIIEPRFVASTRI